MRIVRAQLPFISEHWTGDMGWERGPGERGEALKERTL